MSRKEREIYIGRERVRREREERKITRVGERKQDMGNIGKEKRRGREKKDEMERIGKSERGGRGKSREKRNVPQQRRRHQRAA